MADSELRRIVYKRHLEGIDREFDLAVTNERNGDGIFRIDPDSAPQFVAWSFAKYSAVDSVVTDSVDPHPSDRQNLLLSGTAVIDRNDLKCIVFEREVRDRTTLVVTREANGFLTMGFARVNAGPGLWVYAFHFDSTSAIDHVFALRRGFY